MKKLIQTGILSVALFSSSYAMAEPKPLDLGEHYTLRAYTGQAIGLGLSQVLKVKTLGIAENNSSICATLSGAITGEFVAHNNENGVVAIAAFKDATEVSALSARLLDKEAVALVFGGQTQPEQNYAMVKAMLSELAEKNYQGAIFYHLAVWAPKLMEKAALEDSNIANYLANKQNMYAVTVNAAEGKALIHQVALKDKQQTSVKVLHQVAMNDSWLTLFKRSLLKRN